ncbi:hypothetical protein CL616_01290 [archaeon]|nr:hypothetical protein [archaeon]
MILVVNLCEDELSFNEFVMPVVKEVGDCDVKHYKEVEDVSKYDKIILCGTPLKDHGALEGEIFSWIKSYKGHLLGICAGMQVLALEFGSSLIDNSEIGMEKIKVIRKNELKNKDFEAYSLHTFAIEPSKEFYKLFKSENCVQGIKHKEKEFYGVLFHPEVRNSEIIEEFIKI